ncbi:MAG: DUF4493 domain-containing protein [Bacteroidales bacterium]|nr:DUF4493 domain-containing protein [Bacteroidales bacterium]
MKNLRHILMIIPTSVLLAVASGCTQGDPEEGRYGYLNVDLTKDYSSEIVVKSAEAPKDDMVFSLKAVNKKTNQETVIDDHRQLLSEAWKLSAGNYTISAYSGDELNAAWNTPLYKGSSDVLVKPEQTQTTTIICSMANTMVTVDFADEVKENFSSYSVSVSNTIGDPLIFSSESGNLSDSAYFAQTGTLTWTLEMVNNDGKVFSSGEQTITGVKAKQHYDLKFNLLEDTDDFGGFGLTLTVDETVFEKHYTLVADFSGVNLPAITTNFDTPEEIKVSFGSSDSKIISFSAPRGINNLVLAHSDKTMLEHGLSAHTELVDASSATVSGLQKIGISTSSVIYGSTEANIDITDFIGSLPISDNTYSFMTTVIDTKNHFEQKVFTFHILSPVDAEAVNASAWAKFAILNGKWFVENMPEGIGFQYREASSDEWIDYDGVIAFNNMEKRFSCELFGLEPSTEYVFRAISSKDKDTKEVHFTTEGIQDVPNLSFDNWYKSGSAWYPNANSTVIWDSANPGTSSLGVVPTTPEENDLAVAGEGKKAARLESSTEFGQFAAGNIYTGKFDSVAGLGAKLDWGYEFTARPIALKGYYKYTPKAIDYTKAPYNDLKGTEDNCQVRIMLTDWANKFKINTSTSTFVKDDDPGLIATGEMISGSTNGEYVEFCIPLTYRSTTRIPRYIVIVGAASKLGDFFTGGKGSVLLLDEFELVYDPTELTEEQRAAINYR